MFFSSSYFLVPFNWKEKHLGWNVWNCHYWKTFRWKAISFWQFIYACTAIEFIQHKWSESLLSIGVFVLLCWQWARVQECQRQDTRSSNRPSSRFLTTIVFVAYRLSHSHTNFSSPTLNTHSINKKNRPENQSILVEPKEKPIYKQIGDQKNFTQDAIAWTNAILRI